MLILQQDKKCGHRIFQLMCFVKYLMHKVPNKCSPVKGIWLFFKHVIINYYFTDNFSLSTWRPSGIYSLRLITRKQVEVISVSRLTHSDCSFISFPPELKCSRDHPHPSRSRYWICLLFTDLSKRLQTRMVLRAGDTLVWPSFWASAVCSEGHSAPSHTCWKEWRPGWGTGRPSYTPATAKY